MVRTTPALAVLLLALYDAVAAAPTWPASTDDLEDILYLNSGYRARGFASPVIPCSSGDGPDRNAAAEWIRTAFHDMASANAGTGVGGTDGSILFELSSSEHAGAAFRNTLTRYAPHFSSRTSLADLIAAGLYSATRSCGGPAVPIRGGRKDATQAGPSGQIPDAANAIGIFRNQFTRMGITGVNNTEMIQLVACGHTLGGVHAAEQPLIINSGEFPNNYAHFDTSFATFDNKIATEFLAGTTKNPMVFGKAYAANGRGRDSDRRVYGSDGNYTMAAMADPQTFNNMCKAVFQKMIEIVPRGVTLTDVVTPYDVKPYDVQLTLLDGGVSLGLTGDIRIRTNSRSVSKVQLVYKDRTGAASSTSIDTTLKGTASGFDDTFSFYSFSTSLSVEKSISSFNVIVTSSSGTETFSNNDNGFVVDDSVIFQSPQSCADGSGKLTVVAAVRSSDSPSVQLVARVPRPSNIPVPSLSTATVAMASTTSVGLYKLYSADLSGSSANAAVFGIFAGSASDTYKSIGSLPTACKPFSTATPDLPARHRSRSTIKAELKDDEMTVEKCAAFCNPYKYFGLEFGRECYCGNVQNAKSVSASASDCNVPCKGDQTQTCGAGQRMSLYKTVGWSPPVNPAVDGYDYFGCYSETTGTTRALSDGTTQSDSMTVQKCAASCQGAAFFGLENGNECHCGSKINEGSAPEPEGDCSLLCPGNMKTLCGASLRLNVYKNKTPPTATTATPTPTPTASKPSLSGYTYTGCIVDSLNPRPLSASMTSSSENSYAYCANFCTGFPYFGVEYSNECYCSWVLPAATDIKSDADCNMPCAGTSTQFCGGPNRMTVFKSNANIAVPANPTIPNYGYKGCYTDDIRSRVLTTTIPSDDGMTVERCASACAGSHYFGTEVGRECYCGDSFVGDTKIVDQGECSSKCAGNGGEFCGAWSRLSLYESMEHVNSTASGEAEMDPSFRLKV
ncbi:heme peroxidase [Boeremia exigua]|uniref:heme peroxidase n=1 Tax=Boeremia exigua TaxID=749465 RepID=UPI001E8DAE14|nr:heme peroxidase [Boeremia exigua]KAH6633523.1 heme peroxidase [Boeremia exigua]